MKLTIIVAMDKNRVIGRSGALPWHLADDLQHFRRQTAGKPVLMARKTFESIGRPLPKRRNVVLTRDSSWQAEGVEVVHGLPQALELLSDEPEVMIIGGGTLYAQMMDQADEMQITHVAAEVSGDVVFPQWDEKTWCVTTRQAFSADDKNEYPLSLIHI